MILEGIVTTENEDGSANISPMGPIVDESLSRMIFRPYQTSKTYRNLKRSGSGVFHITDDVELLARAAVDRLETAPALRSEPDVAGWILSDACSWRAFEVQSLDDSQARTEIVTRVTRVGRQRDFFGFNRAKHAVLEGAILVTRLELLPRDEILAEFKRLIVPVNKTGGDQEFRAFEFLRRYVAENYSMTPDQVAPPPGN